MGLRSSTGHLAAGWAAARVRAYTVTNNSGNCTPNRLSAAMISSSLSPRAHTQNRLWNAMRSSRHAATQGYVHVAAALHHSRRAPSCNVNTSPESTRPSVAAAAAAAVVVAAADQPAAWHRRGARSGGRRAQYHRARPRWRRAKRRGRVPEGLRLTLCWWRVQSPP